MFYHNTLVYLFGEEVRWITTRFLQQTNNSTTRPWRYHFWTTRFLFVFNHAVGLPPFDKLVNTTFRPFYFIGNFLKTFRLFSQSDNPSFSERRKVRLGRFWRILRRFFSHN